MDPFTLASGAMFFLKPFLKKTGEKIAEEIGSSLWSWLGDKLSTKKELPAKCTDMEVADVRTLLESELTTNQILAQALEAKLQEIKSSAQGQMIIENQGNVEKQVNITNISGGTINL